MKLPALGIIAIVVVAVIIGVLVLFNGSHTSTSPVQTVTSPTPISSVSPTQTSTASPIQKSATPTEYPEALKTKVRNEFISSCNTAGHYSIPVCTCTADYLAKNYSEGELAQMYIQYHTTNQIPSAIKTAAETCSAK